MSEEDICDKCGQIKRKMNSTRKFLFWQYSVRRKMMPKLIDKMEWYTFCDECKMWIRKKHRRNN